MDLSPGWRAAFGIASLLTALIGLSYVLQSFEGETFGCGSVVRPVLPSAVQPDGPGGADPATCVRILDGRREAAAAWLPVALLTGWVFLASTRPGPGRGRHWSEDARTRRGLRAPSLRVRGRSAPSSGGAVSAAWLLTVSRGLAFLTGFLGPLVLALLLFESGADPGTLGLPGTLGVPGGLAVLALLAAVGLPLLGLLVVRRTREWALTALFGLLFPTLGAVVFVPLAAAGY